jgi:hypothetical protein
MSEKMKEGEIQDSYGLKNRNSEGRRKIKEMQNENDSLERAQTLASDISSSGNGILTSLNS